MIKLGIIGTNWITTAFVQAAQHTKEYQLTAVYSRTLAKATEFSQEYTPQPSLYTDLTTFFASEDFDTVYIASPNSLHFSQIKQALLAGKNVIVEKPACVNPSEFAEIRQILQEHSELHFFEAARHLHEENFKIVQEEVQNIGQIQGATLTYAQFSSRYLDYLAGKEPNIFTLKYAGGALQDLGVYLVYEALSWFGMPEEVSYIPLKLANGIDGQGLAILKYKDYNVTLNCSKIYQSNQDSEIYGSDKTILIEHAGELKAIKLISNQQPNIEIISQTTADHDLMAAEASAFSRIINHPQNKNYQKLEEEWLNLAQNVNQVLYDLRQSADINFPSEK
ncbi:Gfo/Idh/MocA family protein [Ligilactobacillus ceti]|uniref:Oxidoreductase n=1 Tax=Ligilactobacillus ceti DSM 22408 TaxID=1122146 RepID=A0A0R2KLT4_9LACO|nr:Gfo/Idh/MocA family oxidoreductase [Ligilactobacillus ceti]KRN90352.1 oxidoreductase [Ligilactobacillus ceti DSM 22408]